MEEERKKTRKEESKKGRKEERKKEKEQLKPCVYWHQYMRLLKNTWPS